MFVHEIYHRHKAQGNGDKRAFIQAAYLLTASYWLFYSSMMETVQLPKYTIQHVTLVIVYTHRFLKILAQI